MAGKFPVRCGLAGEVCYDTPRAAWMRARRILLAGLALLAVGAVGLLLGVTELRSALLFKVAPVYARDTHLLRYRDAAGSEVAVLGTIHTAHLDSTSYSLWHLAALVAHLRPDRLLVESRPGELLQGNTCDGPVEMGFVTLEARALGVAVAGMDSWERGSPSGRSNDAREDAMFEHTRPHLHLPGVTLIVTGFSHVPEFARRLETSGYRLTPPSPGQAELFAPGAGSRLFPRGMAACVEARIAHDERERSAEPDPGVRQGLEGAIAVRRRLLALVQATGER